MRRLNEQKRFYCRCTDGFIEEWHPTENKENTPNNVKTGSDKYITWIFKECSHVWITQAKKRAINNTGCPKCHERYNVGFPELAIYFYIKQIFKDAQLNSIIEEIGKYKSVDVHIPSLNLVIEYDGGHTHRARFELDFEKSSLIIENGYDLIRIRDKGLAPLNIKGVYEYLNERRTNKSVGEMIKKVLLMIEGKHREFEKDIEEVIALINVDVDTIPILTQIPPIIEKENLLKNYPESKNIWDYKRNYPLKPEHFKPYSNFKVWFTCEQGHTTLSQINSKTKGHGCRVCLGQVATEAPNFELLFPEIEKEWNNELNIGTPNLYFPFSNEVVYWICPKCKSAYNKMINDRTGNGENCPYCAGKRVKKTNCLSTTHPELVKEWDYYRNVAITPDDVTKGSHDKVYWICKRGHSYPAYVYRRAGSNGTGCPKCYELYGRRLPRKVKRENSLAVKKPELAKQWHPTKNDKSPFEVGVSARRKYWWLCENGHEWEAPPNSRRSIKCKYCNNREGEESYI